MNNLLNTALVAILVVAGLVLFTPADEPQSYAHIETPAVTVDLGNIVAGDPENGIHQWYNPKIWDMVDDELISPNGHHSLIFPPHETGNKWAIILLTHDDWEDRPKEPRFVRWFTGGEEKEIRWFGSDAKMWHFTESSPHNKKFREAYGDNYPIVAVQQFDGANSFKASGDNIRDCTSLYRGILKGLGKIRPVKAIVQHRKKVRQVCPDGNCTPNRSRRPFSFLRPFKRPDDTDGTEPPPVDDPPPVDKPLVHPDYKAPIPDSVSVAPATEPGTDNSLLALLAAIGGTVVGLFTKQGS